MLANSFPAMILINMLQGPPVVKHIEDPSTNTFFLETGRRRKLQVDMVLGWHLIVILSWI